MVPIDDYAEKPDMDINEVEITEDSEKIKEIARSMLNRTTGSIRTRSLVYFKNTISGRENYQVCPTRVRIKQGEVGTGIIVCDCLVRFRSLFVLSIPPLKLDSVPRVIGLYRL